MDKATCKTKKGVEFRNIKSRNTCHFGKFPKFHFSQFLLAKQKCVHIKMSYIQNVFTFISTLAAFGKLIHTDKSHLKGCLQIINTYILMRISSTDATSSSCPSLCLLQAADWPQGRRDCVFGCQPSAEGFL